MAVSENRIGAVYAVAAYLAWGFVPLYWQPLRHVPALEILGHRVVWSCVFLGLLVLAKGRVGEAVTAMKDKRILARLALSTLLIAGNWYVYIWAVTHNHVIEASLGYFTTPLVNMLLGLVILKERLRGVQWVCVALATAAVVWLSVAVGHVPWVGLVLAASFGTYGFVRKTARVDSLVGLLLETTLLLPIAGVFLLSVGGTTAEVTPMHWAFLVGGGLVTAVPLLWFADAVRRLPLTVLGFFQYLSPSVQFLLGLFWFHEPLAVAQLFGFSLIWIALLLFSVEAGIRARKGIVT